MNYWNISRCINCKTLVNDYHVGLKYFPPFDQEVQLSHSCDSGVCMEVTIPYIMHTSVHASSICEGL